MEIGTSVAGLLDLATVFGLKILGAIAILLLGRWGAKILKNVADRMMIKAKVEETLRSFVRNLIYIALITFVVIAALGKLGVQTASFVAVIGAAGLAVGLAMQGSLSNFAAGVLIILFRPFKVGDYIEAGGTAGTVEEIHIFVTQLKSPDNKAIIVPNSTITGGTIVNVSAKPTRRVDLTVGIGYEDDIDKAKQLIRDLLSADHRILPEPAPTVAVSELGDSSVNFVVRPWVKSADYWSVYFDLTETFKKRFDAEGISIPFPQRDVHIVSEKAA